MKLDQTQDELLSELWANHQDLGAALTMLESVLKCGETFSTEANILCSLRRLHNDVNQYTTEIQHISDILVRNTV